jgi:hypothetical protein
MKRAIIDMDIAVYGNSSYEFAIDYYIFIYIIILLYYILLYNVILLTVTTFTGKRQL